MTTNRHSTNVLRASAMNKIAAIIAALVLPLPVFSAAPPELEAALLKWAHNEPVQRYQFALVNLNDDALADAVVLITDPDYCGSGGCNMVVFKGTTRGFDPVSSSTITRKPILVLGEVQNGWHSLSVAIGGGGVKSGQVMMRFNGKRYPGNPSMQNVIDPSALKSSRELIFKEGK